MQALSAQSATSPDELLLQQCHASSVVVQGLIDLTQTALVPALAAVHVARFGLEARRTDALAALRTLQEVCFSAGWVAGLLVLALDLRQCWGKFEPFPQESGVQETRPGETCISWNKFSYIVNCTAGTQSFAGSNFTAMTAAAHAESREGRAEGCHS